MWNNNRVISIEIGNVFTRVCELDYKKKNPHVYNCFRFNTPENTFDDGYIRDKEGFVNVVKEKLQDNNIQTTKVVFSVASSKIANREILIPQIKENKIQEIIDLNSTEYFPVDISEYIINYKVLEKISNEDEKKLRLLVLAAPNNLIKNYYSIAEMLGLEIVAIDYIGNSSFQTAKRQVGQGVNLVVQINEDTSIINIIDNGVLSLQRTIPYGLLDSMDIVVDSDYYNTTDYGKSVSRLIEKDLINPRFYSYNNNSEAAITVVEDNVNNRAVKKLELKEEITDSFKNMINNIIRVSEYYQSNNKDKKIEGIYVTGLGSRVRGLDILAKNETGIQVQLIDNLKSVIFRSMQKGIIDLFEYATCVGASYDPINLIPIENRDKAARSNYLQRVRIMLFASIAFSGALVSLSYLSYKTALIENKEITERIDQLADINIIYNNHGELTKVYEEVKLMYSMTTSYPLDFLNKVIKDMEDYIPSKVIFEYLSSSSDAIIFNVKANSKEEAAKLLQQLKKIDYLNDIKTNSIAEIEDENGVKTIKFIVTANYNFNLLQEIVDGED